MIVISARRVSAPLFFVAIMALGLGVFPSTATHFRLGQISMVVCVILFVVSEYHQKIKPGLIGCLLAISLVKPQLIVLFFPVFITVLIRDGGVRKVIKVLSLTLFWFLISIIPLFLLSPGWIRDFVQNLVDNPGWAYPTFYTILRTILPSDTLPMILAIILLFIGIGITIAISYRLEQNEALLWSMAFTPVFSPVVWSWDFVLIYPLLLHLVFDRKYLLTSNIVLIGFVICLVLYITMVQLGYADDRYGFWVPIFLNVLMFIGHKSRRKSQVSTSGLANEGT